MQAVAPIRGGAAQKYEYRLMRVNSRLCTYAWCLTV